MSFAITKEAEVVVVDVEGQLIVGNRQELKQKVLDELERGERKFLIDFSQTGYIDSSGLGVLVSLSKKIREQGGELRLANLNDDLRTLFELTKLDTLFQISDTRDRALSSCCVVCPLGGVVRLEAGRAASSPGFLSRPLAESVLAMTATPLTDAGFRVSLQVDIPSDVAYIERVVDLVRHPCAELSYNKHHLALNVPVALSEALSNAILRG